MSINHQLNVNPKDMRGIGIHLSRLESGRQMSVIDTFLKKNKNSATMKVCSESTEGGPAISQPMERENANINCQQNKVTSVENVKTNSIMNFFTVKKSLSQSSTSKTKSHSELLCPENFDKDVFMSLPKDIQDELVKEFNLKDVPEITEKSVTDPGNREECNEGTNIGNDNRKETDFTERSNVHQDLLCSQTIDKDVIAALPDDIKREVMREYGLREIPESVAGSSKTKQEDHENLSLSQIDMNVLAELPEDLRKEIERNLNNKHRAENVNIYNISSGEKRENKLCDNLTLKEIRCLIKEWISVELEPQKCDIEMLMEYLQQLVEKRQLDDLHVAMNCLYRCVEKSGQQVWQEAYFTIVNGVQQIMQAVYNADLLVQETF